MADEEQTLLPRVAADDQEALRILYAHYRPRLWRYLWRRLDGDVGAVEDALQETWLAIWRGAPGYRPQGQVGAWIFQIAHRHVAHLRRDHARTLEGRLHRRALDAEVTSWPPLSTRLVLTRSACSTERRSSRRCAPSRLRIVKFWSLSSITASRSLRSPRFSIFPSGR
jgi:RNA polymerase sigma factor (sigma-70 family)